jgi:NAD(P)-dependent dehydrogenase (short-subunit alcohol dehydrogenase family)
VTAYKQRPVTGERIVITGATNGIGKEIARAVVRKGADVTVVARNPAKAESTAAELEREPGAAGAPDVVIADLGDLTSVREAAAQLRERYERIDVLVNNAGINSPVPFTSVDGYEVMMATNHLGPFLLTNLVLDLVTKAAPSRIVVTASEAHRTGGRPNLDALAEPISAYRAAGRQGAYGRSKLMNILFTQELAQRLDGTGVTVNCFCPGAVNTGLIGDNPFVIRAGNLLSRTPLIRRPEQGARMGVRLILDPAFSDITGGFYSSTPGAGLLPTLSVLKDAAYRHAAWDRSADLVGLAH